MTIDATFWVAVSFFIFLGVLVYLKIPQKISDTLNSIINSIKDEILEAEKLKDETKNLLNESQSKVESAYKESQIIIDNAKKESEKMIIEMNEKFYRSSENKKKITELKIEMIKNNAIKEIKNSAIKIAIESASKIIQTSIDKSKLDNIFKENLEEVKKSLKNNTRV